MKRTVPYLAAVLLACPAGGFAQEVLPGATPAGDVMALAGDGLARALDGLPALVEAVMEDAGIPGMAVAVIHEGRTIFAEGYGVRDVRTGAPVTPATVFQIASISKPIASTVAAIAVSRGQVDWDDPIIAHLPAFRLSDPHVTRTATIGDFFAHRTGLPHAAGDALEDLGYDRQTIIERLALVPLGPFRASYGYANFGTTIAAEAVAAAVGTEWESLAEASLFDPLGMAATSFRHADYLAAADRAVLHALADGRFLPLFDRDPDAQAPAGGVSSSVEDMARWVALLLGDGTLDGQTLFTPEALLPALLPQVTNGPAARAGERSSAYGYGFNVGVTAGGRTVLSHSGAFLLGAATTVQMLPSADLGIVVLSNAAPVGAVEAIAAHFMEVAQFGRAHRDWPAAYAAAMAPLYAPLGDLAGQSRPADPAPPGPAARYAGFYDNPFYGPAEVVAEEGDGDGGLTLILGPDRLRLPLDPWDGPVFALTPGGENAPPGTRSSVRFAFDDGSGDDTGGDAGANADMAATGFTIELYDGEGLGTWRR